MARICNWCGIALRWWQWKNCRKCRRALAFSLPSPPVPYMSHKEGNR